MTNGDGPVGQAEVSDGRVLMSDVVMRLTRDCVETILGRPFDDTQDGPDWTTAAPILNAIRQAIRTEREVCIGMTAMLCGKEAAERVRKCREYTAGRNADERKIAGVPKEP